MKYIFSIVILFYSMVSVSQDARILSGIVTEKKTGKPVSGVIVTVKKAGSSNVLKFTQTDAEGRFLLRLNSSTKGLELGFRMMGYAEKSVMITGEVEFYRVEMEEEQTRIKEVVVKSKAINQRGDTVTYLVSSFANIQDKTLADVLKKMPGIEVSKNGAITYNGVALNKFYIEGKDMLGGSYGLATNNINQQDVGSVEVMENHQPIKALGDISFSRNPAINIKLKNDAKSHWVGTVKAGIGGSPVIWKDELMAMRFTAKAQTLNTFKTNNTGDDVTSEIRSFSLEEILDNMSKGYRLSSYINITPDYLRDIDENRYLFNKTHLLSSNNLWTLGKNFDLTSQVSYTNSRVTSDSYTGLTYFLPDKNVVVKESNHSFLQQNTLTGSVLITTNKPDYYLKNTLKADLKWNVADVTINGTYPNKQRGETPHHQIINDFELIKRKGKFALGINSYSILQKRQEQLLSYGKDTISQLVNTSALYNNTSTSFSIGINPISISGRIGICGLIRRFESDLKGVSDTLGLLRNRINMNYLSFYVTPKAEMKKGSTEVSLEVPVSISPYLFNDKETMTQDKTARFNLSGILFYRYFLTSRVAASVTGQISQSKINEQQFYNGLILNTYRSISKGIVDYSRGYSRTVSGSISYKVPLSGLFINAGGTVGRSSQPFMSERSFIGQYVISSLIPVSYGSSRKSVFAGISKRIEVIKGMVALKSGYSLTEGSVLQEKEKNPFTSAVLDLSTKVTSNVGTWSNMVYEVSYAKNRLTYRLGNLKSSSSQLSQKLIYSLNPGDRWYLRLIAEYYRNEIIDGLTKDFFLSDADLTYRFKGGWELNVAANNLLNRRSYSYSYYTELTSVSKTYDIRGRTFLVSLFFRF